MRPTDEDQPGSRRPNLMAASRRNANDINILAMLDGLGTRPHAKRNMLWYGAGGALACALIGTLAWLVRAPADHLDAKVVAGLPAPAAAASTPPVPIERISEVLPAPVALQPSAGGATIVNVADGPTPAPAAPELAMAATPAPAERPPHTPAAPKPAPALHTPAPKSLAAHLPPARGTIAGVHPGAAHPGPRRSLPTAKPAPAPAAVDTDVALISAIIQHAANQREAADDAGCAGKSCVPRMPARP